MCTARIFCCLFPSQKKVEIVSDLLDSFTLTRKDSDDLWSLSSSSQESTTPARDDLNPKIARGYDFKNSDEDLSEKSESDNESDNECDNECDKEVERINSQPARPIVAPFSR